MKILPADVVRIAPMTFAQERLWRHSQTATASAAQVLALVDRIDGPLDVPILRDCLSAVVRRHEILRTTFAWDGDTPIQVVHAEKPVDLPVCAVADGAAMMDEVHRLLGSEAALVTDLVCGPVIVFSLVRISANLHFLLRPCHHIIWDAPSTMVFWKELVILYQAKVEGRPASLLAAYQAAEDGRRERQKDAAPDAYAAELAWLRARLTRRRRWLPRRSSAKRRVLPFSPPAIAPSIGECVFSMPLEEGLEGRLDALRRSTKTTHYVVWLSLLVALLAHENQSRDVALGTYMTTRRGMAMNSLIGFCVNLVMLAFVCDSSLTVRDWLAKVGRDIADFRVRSLVPYERVRGALAGFKRAAGEPQIFFDTPLAYGREEIHFCGLTRRFPGLVPPDRFPHAFSVRLDRIDGRLTCEFLFDGRKYDPLEVRGFGARLVALAGRFADGPQLPIRRHLSDLAPTRQ